MSELNINEVLQKMNLPLAVENVREIVKKKADTRMEKHV
jgi:hypothetical protein